MMLKHFLLLAVPIAGMACTPLFSAEDCEVSFGGHGGLGAPYNIGNGLVANSGGDAPPESDGRTVYKFLEIEDCRSGQEVFITYSEYKVDYDNNIIEPEIYDPSRIDEFEQRLGHIDGGIPGAVELAEEFGYSVNNYVAIYQQAAAESCRCRAFYPELRGDKEPYEAKQ